MYCTFIYLQGPRRCSDSQTYPCTPWRRRSTVPAALGAVPRLGPPPPLPPHPPFVPETGVLLLTSPRTAATPAAAIPAPIATPRDSGISLPMWNRGRPRSLSAVGRRGRSRASGPPTGAIVKQWRGRRPIWTSEAAECPTQRTETGQLGSTVTVQRNACQYF
jgi:hypothetical protein